MIYANTIVHTYIQSTVLTDVYSSSLVIAKTALDLSRMISMADQAALVAQGHAYRLRITAMHAQHSTVHTSRWSHWDIRKDI